MQTIVGANIDAALDDAYPSAMNFDCVSDHVTLFILPNDPGSYQIVEKGWDPVYF